MVVNVVNTLMTCRFVGGSRDNGIFDQIIVFVLSFNTFGIWESISKWGLRGFLQNQLPHGLHSWIPRSNDLS